MNYDRLDLEKYCIVRPYEQAWLPPYDGKFHQVGPARSIKRYPATKRLVRIYRGAVIQPRDDLRPVEEIRKLLDKRPLPELLQQAEDALKQLLHRAHCGDQHALSAYLRTTRAAVRSLELLAKHQQENVRSVAETSSDWPLNVGQHDMPWAKQELRKLGVAVKLPLASKSSLRTRLRSPWTRLALDALAVCAENKQVIPALTKFAVGARRKREALPFSRQTQARAMFHYLGNGDCVIIADWQAKCVKLSDPITKSNVNDWWDVVKGCVLEYWENSKPGCGALLELIPDAKQKNSQSDKAQSGEYYKQNKDYRKRNRALDRVKQAFESLVGVTCST